ncbi:MAG TPA: hypothetical protein VFE47_00275 [Tepidisphaeraceae bacterium]|nr:hypothetical protein [Tepidisphaeraceae bacterium]
MQHQAKSRRRFFLLGVALFGLTFCLFNARLAMADGAASAPAFSGSFSDNQLTLTLSESPAGYSGVIVKGDNRFPVTASVKGQTLNGTFQASGAAFPFTASFADGRLVLATGGKTHTLVKAVQNPLSRTGQGLAHAPPAAAAPGIFDDAQTFGDFAVLGSTPGGKTLFMQLKDAPTLESALTQTADALGKVLDAKPALGNAFADAKTKEKGGVSFTGKYKGHDVRGVIFSGVAKGTASATVIIAAADATKDDVAALYAAMPAPPAKMTTHKFPDGSGSIDLPEGWTTPDQTAAFGIGVIGPAGQRVIWNASRTIMDPNCGMVRTGRQAYQLQVQNYHFAVNRYQQLLAFRQRNPNFPLPPAPTPPVEPNADPNIQMPGIIFCRECNSEEDIIKYFNPILEQKQRMGGKGYSTIDKVFAVFPGEPNPFIAGSHSGTAYLAITDHIGDDAHRMRAVTSTMTSPLIKGESWEMSTCTMRAPDETFDKDFPVMSAIMNSVTLNMDVVNQVQSRQGNAIRKIFADKFKVMIKAGQDFQDQQARQFASHEQQIAAQEQARHDSNSDFIEYIGGVRKVLDTHTGKTVDVDLFHSDAITDGLNGLSNDPHQFVQIPLRYLR